MIEFMAPAFVIMYGFASLGVTLFGGLINKDPDRNQYKVKINYYNYKNISHLLLFQILFLNQYVFVWLVV